MHRPVAVALVAILLVACGGSATPPGGQPSPTASGLGGGSAPTVEPSGLFGGGGFAQPTLRPSAARFRVVNGYSSPPGGPSAVDVYGGYSAGEGHKPLISVPFGAISDWFDPGVFDDQGNAALAYYPAGKRSSDEELISKSETLKGTERVTVFITAGDETNPSGGRYGRLSMVFEKGTDVAGESPEPGKAILYVDTIGLESVLSKKERLWFVSAGGPCLFQPNPVEGEGPQPVSPGSRTAISLDPAATKVAIHEYSDTDTSWDCRNAPLLDVPLTLPASRPANLFVMSPGGDRLQALVVPFED